MRLCSHVLTTAAVLAAALAASGATAPPAFTRKPVAVKTSAGVKITFAVNRPTDVAVFVEDAKGRVVRHLAAGVLGPNAPAPLKKNTLEQELVWDGKDDRGRPAPPTGCRVRVSLGLTPTFDRFLNDEPGPIGNVVGLAVSRRGELFVWRNIGGVHGGSSSATCTVYDRTGTYRRTVIPFPTGLADDKLAGLRRLNLLDGRQVPFMFQGETRSIYPALGSLPRQRPVITRDGRVLTCGVEEVTRVSLRYNQSGVGRLVVVREDGSVPTSCLGPRLLAGFISAYGSPSLALSPDDKMTYATGLRSTKYQGPFFHAVYRCPKDGKTFEAFIGDPKTSGDGTRRLDTPLCLDTDAAGNLYVADYANHRIAVFKPGGAHLADVNVKRPSRVEVHRGTGAVYVLTGAHGGAQLVKFDGCQVGKEVCRLGLRFRDSRMHLWPVMALDDTTDPPVIWVGGPWHMPLRRIEDGGARFGKPAVVKDAARWSFLDIHADRERDEVCFNAAGYLVRIHGETGRRTANRLPRLGQGARISVGKDGRVYAHAHHFVRVKTGLASKGIVVRRFDRDLKPVPFKATGADRVPIPSNLRVRGRGLTADLRGNIYVIRQKGAEELAKGDARAANAVALITPDGAVKQPLLIDAEFRSVNSVRVDHAGNVYLAVGARPGKMPVPDAFRGLNLGKHHRKLFVQPHGFNSNQVNWYPMMYGSIVKFPPSGGTIRKGSSSRPANFGCGNPTEVKGAEWMHPGISSVPSWRTPNTPDVCLCETPCFDVDGFGRSFFADALRWQAGVLDTRGNVICRFGDYGNRDSAGPESKIPTPAIPFAWPQSVAVTDRAVYVGDRVSQRIVRARLKYAAEEACPVK